MKIKAKGFSTIDLLVYISIVSVLMIFLVPRFGKLFEKVKELRTTATMSSIVTALQQYSLDVGKFPSSREGLDALIDRPGGKEGSRWKGPYLEGYSEIPQDGWGGEFEYNSPPREHTKEYKRFELISRGAGEDEGDDIHKGF
ncbi:type II secretion system protein GspG [Candidatus Dependentiae bacterium]